MTLRKDEIASLTQRARTAQRERRWAEAEALWRNLLAEVPRDHAGRAGLATLLLARGRSAEARTLSQGLLADAPSDVGALTLAARMAADDDDWIEAARHWRSALAFKADAPAAVAGFGNALLNARNFPAADEWAAKLKSRFPSQPFGRAFEARLALARGDHEGALRIWREAAKEFPADAGVRRDLSRALMDAEHFAEAEGEARALLAISREEGLAELSNILARREPDVDQTEFWKRGRNEFPNNLTFVRREMMSALKAGRADDAIAAMDALLESGDASIADAGLAVGIAHLHAARGDTNALRRLVKRYLAALRGTSGYALARLRLSRIIFAYVVKQDRAPRLPYRERTRRYVRAAPLKPRPRALLERSIALEEALATQSQALLDTDVSRAECTAFIRHVRERIARREPFSFVRVNDGEANALSYESAYAAHFDRDAAEREHVWWRRTIPTEERRVMTARVAEAIWNADAVGIPTFGRILRDVHLAANDDFTTRRTGRGLVAGAAAFERWREFRPSDLPPPLFTSANLQQDLQRWNVYPELFDGIGEVVLVSGHRNIPDAMKELFNLEIAAFIPVPPGDASLHLRPENDARVLPDMLDDIVVNVEAKASGRTVVIGAGYLGKWIVHRAKAAGGIALDLGSALDYWVGLKTRSYQDLA